MKSKTLIVFALAALACFGQSPNPTNIAGVGVSYQPGGSPAVAGTGLYARQLTGGTYAFTVIDALPISVKPFTVTTQTSAGVAQKLFTLGTIPIYAPTAAGISWTGSNTGWSWSTGALAVIPVKGNFKVMPSVRVLKSSVSNRDGYQIIGGLIFGWNW